MESITYEIDPDGDIELVLNKPNEQNIVPRLRLSTRIGDDACEDLRLENPPCHGRYAIFNKLYDKEKPTAAACKIHIRVSSCHLKFASRVFRVMLEGPWKEGTSSSEPFRQIHATGWDALAFAIILDAIHGRHRGIPDELSIGLVTRVATVIGYYECHDALYVYFEPWMEQDDMSAVPLWALYKETLLCVYVAWVFSDELMLERMANLVFRQSEGLSQIDTSDVPMGGVLERIDKQRQDCLYQLFEKLDDVQMSLLRETHCPAWHNTDCVCRTLGVLMRAKHELVRSKNPDLYPHVRYPYEGYSIDAVLKMIESTEDKKAKTKSECTVVARMSAVVQNVTTHVVDFTLKK